MAHRDEIKSGQAFRPSDGWLEMVRAELKARDWSQTKLATEVGADKSTMTDLLKGDATRYANDVADKLGLPRPQPQISTREEWEWLRLGQRLHATKHPDAPKILEQVRVLVDGLEKASRARAGLDDFLPTDGSDPDGTT